MLCALRALPLPLQPSHPNHSISSPSPSLESSVSYSYSGSSPLSSDASSKLSPVTIPYRILAKLSTLGPRCGGGGGPSKFAHRATYPSQPTEASTGWLGCQSQSRTTALWYLSLAATSPVSTS